MKWFLILMPLPPIALPDVTALSPHHPLSRANRPREPPRETEGTWTAASSDQGLPTARPPPSPSPQGNTGSKRARTLPASYPLTPRCLEQFAPQTSVEWMNAQMNEWMHKRTVTTPWGRHLGYFPSTLAFLFFFWLLIYLLAAIGLRCCVGAFSSCGARA